MAKFQFRLTTLLRLREAARDQRRGRLAEAYAAEQKLLTRRGEVEVEMNDLKRLHRGPQGPGTVNVDQLLSADRYEVLLKAEIRVIDDKHALLAEEIEKRRQDLVSADREVRLLEKFRDKLLERHRHEEAAVEMKQLDEVASRGWWEADD